MATKASQGSTRNGRDSQSKRLGLKKFDSEKVRAGNIIVRQRGTKYHPGMNVGRGSDDTLFAKIDGYLFFSRRGKNKKIVTVLTPEQIELLENSKTAAPA